MTKALLRNSDETKEFNIVLFNQILEVFI